MVKFNHKTLTMRLPHKHAEYFLIHSFSYQACLFAMTLHGWRTSLRGAKQSPQTLWQSRGRHCEARSNLPKLCGSLMAKFNHKTLTMRLPHKHAEYFLIQGFPYQACLFAMTLHGWRTPLRGTKQSPETLWQSHGKASSGMSLRGTKQSPETLWGRHCEARSNLLKLCGNLMAKFNHKTPTMRLPHKHAEYF